MTTLGTIESAYRRRYPAFLRVAFAMLGEQERARDAVQETFARAVRARAGVGRPGQLEPWLWTTLTNVCRDTRRRERTAALPAAPAATNGNAETWPELRAAVAALPERQRLAIFLRYYADLDYEAIAAVLGVERGTVAASLHTARTTLRDAIEEEVTR